MNQILDEIYKSKYTFDQLIKAISAPSEIIKNENNPHLQIRQPGFQLNFTIYSPIYQK